MQAANAYYHIINVHSVKLVNESGASKFKSRDILGMADQETVCGVPLDPWIVE